MITRVLLLLSISLSSFSDVTSFNWRLEEGWKSLSVFEELSQVEGELSIMWWNVDCTSAVDAPYDRDPKNVFYNLESLVESDQIPDILILGENCPRNFKQKTFEKLVRAYGGEQNRVDLYHTIGLSHLLYERARQSAKEDSPLGKACKKMGRNAVHRNGIRVFFKSGIQIKSSVGVLSGGGFANWPEIENCSKDLRTYSIERIARDRRRSMATCERQHLDQFLTETGQDADLRKEFTREFWDRNYLKLLVTLPSGKKFELVAVHLAQPWKVFLGCSKSQEEGAAVAFELMAKMDSISPTNLQIHELASQLGSLVPNVPRIVIGDWNYPSSMGEGFEIMQSYFGRSVVSEDKDLLTYYPPDHFSGVGMGAFNLDHAFASGPIEPLFGRVLPMAGAEHLPIYTVFKFNSN